MSAYSEKSPPLELDPLIKNELQKRTFSEIDKYDEELINEQKKIIATSSSNEQKNIIASSSSNDPFMKLVEIKNIATDVFYRNIFTICSILLLIVFIMIIINDVIFYYSFIKSKLV